MDYFFISCSAASLVGLLANRSFCIESYQSDNGSVGTVEDVVDLPKAGVETTVSLPPFEPPPTIVLGEKDLKTQKRNFKRDH